MVPPPLNPQNISYQLSREEVIRVYRSRTLFRPRRLRSLFIILAVAVMLYFLDAKFRYVSYVFFGFVLLLPLTSYLSIARLIGQHSMFTAPRTLSFGPAGIVVTGPNWRSETAWNFYNGFSENPRYFFLHTSDTGFDTLFPKAAFTVAQQEEFRRYATQHSG